MNKIIYDVELQPKNSQNKWRYYYKYISLLKNKKDCIKLCLYCLKYCINKYKQDKKKETYIKEIINLILKSFIDNNFNVTEKFTNLDRKFSAYVGVVLNNIAWNISSIITNSASNSIYETCSCFYWISMLRNINMNLPLQYLQTLLRTTKQFNIENPYSNHIKQIVKQDIDKLELVDYNMLLDISNEYYDIYLNKFDYENIFSRRNLIELIRREYQK